MADAASGSGNGEAEVVSPPAEAFVQQLEPSLQELERRMQEITDAQGLLRHQAAKSRLQLEGLDATKNARLVLMSQLSSYHQKVINLQLKMKQTSVKMRSISDRANRLKETKDKEQMKKATNTGSG